MFNYFKNIIKGYLENKENAYSAKKNPRASRALRQALDPGPSNLTLFALLQLHSIGDFAQNLFGPPPDLNPGSATDMILCLPRVAKLIEISCFIQKNYCIIFEICLIWQIHFEKTTIFVNFKSDITFTEMARTCTNMLRIENPASSTLHNDVWLGSFLIIPQDVSLFIYLSHRTQYTARQLQLVWCCVSSCSCWSQKAKVPSIYHNRNPY